jgi:hypothetical protein
VIAARKTLSAIGADGPMCIGGAMTVAGHERTEVRIIPLSHGGRREAATLPLFAVDDTNPITGRAGPIAEPSSQISELPNVNLVEDGRGQCTGDPPVERRDSFRRRPREVNERQHL